MRALLPLAHAQPIDGLVAQDHHRPGERAAARRVVGGRAPPDVREAFLQHVLGLLFIARHFQNERIQARRKAIVERAESRLVASRDPRKQLRVDLAVAFLGWGHGSVAGPAWKARACISAAAGRLAQEIAEFQSGWQAAST